MSHIFPVGQNTTKEEAHLPFFPYSGGVLEMVFTEPSSPSYARHIVITTISDPHADDPQAYYWTREWQQGELEADEDIRLGNTVTFSDIDDAIAWLDTEED